MSSLLIVWETQGYKRLVERILDGLRVQLFRGQAFITQGSGAYWQLLIPRVGVLQINLLSPDGTLGVYSVPDALIPMEVLRSREPNLADIRGLQPIKCNKEELPTILGEEIGKLVR